MTHCENPECLTHSSKRWINVPVEALEIVQTVCSRKCMRRLLFLLSQKRDRTEDEPGRKLTEEDHYNPSALGCPACGDRVAYRSHPGAPHMCEPCWMSLSPDEKTWYWKTRKWSHALWEIVDRAREYRNIVVEEGSGSL